MPPAENWGCLNLFSESCINVWSGAQARDICFLQKPAKRYFRATDPETLKKKLCFCSPKNLCPPLKKTKQQTSPACPPSPNQAMFPKLTPKRLETENGET